MANIVAITGGIGCGKSEATRVFSEQGVPVVDLDDIAHAMSAPGSPTMLALRNAFGDAYFDADGALNRLQLRELVFANPEALQHLNDIMHPAIRAAAMQQIASHADAPYVVLAIPLLVETRADWAHIQHVLVIDCDEETQLQRIMQRSQLSAGMAQAMMAAQSSRAERLTIADTVIENQHSLTEFRQNILDFHKNYLKTCQSEKRVS